VRGGYNRLYAMTERLGVGDIHRCDKALASLLEGTLPTHATRTLPPANHAKNDVPCKSGPESG
jgi:hypothetical protein